MVQTLELFRNSRCRWPPSWVLLPRHIRRNFIIKRSRIYFVVKDGENRSNSSKVTVLCRNSRWRPSKRRHLGFGYYVTFDVTVELCAAQSTLVSNMVKIGPVVQKLQCFFEIQDGIRRHLGVCHNLEFNQTGALSVTRATWRSNLVKIGQTVQ